MTMQRIRFIDNGTGRMVDFPVSLNVTVRDGLIVDISPSYKELIGVPIDRFSENGTTKLSDLTAVKQ